MLDAVVLGNTALDVLCFGVEDVPRYDSISFARSAVGPGGCGSNVAVNLALQGVRTALAARLGEDASASLLQDCWKASGVNMRFVRRCPGEQTGVSVGLIDRDHQPRFIHTPGASAGLCTRDLDLGECTRLGARWLHISGFFILPGLEDGTLPAFLEHVQQSGMTTSLDVVDSPAMDTPDLLLPSLPFLDVLFCNRVEARKLSGCDGPLEAAAALRGAGAALVIVKLGAAGCWVSSNEFTGSVPGIPARVVDTTGAGDAFDAGFIAARLDEKPVPEACQAGNAAGAKAVQHYGAVSS